MEDISEDLIMRFFKGECDRKEAQTVLQYFEENKQAAGKYIGKPEWDEIKSSDVYLSKERSKQMLDKIRTETYGRYISNIRTYKWAIAASLILIISAGLVFFKYSANVKSVIAFGKKDNLWRSETNVSDITRNIVLADGSSVDLAPRSAVSYPYPFATDKREVRLSGKGLFRIARDEYRPFTVISGNLATTALGTEFTIEAFPGTNSVIVKLHEGKVKVNRVNANNVFYLLPAQELTFEKSTGSIIINGSNGVREISPKNTRVLEVKQNGVSISFNREPLKNVFDQLERAYHIDLIHPEDGLKDYYFTGNFHENDSLERVLRIIAQTNDLELIKTASSYKIIKKR